MGFWRKATATISSMAVVFSVSGVALAAPAAAVKSSTVSKSGGLAVIRGVVREEGGSPIVGATVAVFRIGTAQVLKQVKSAADGSFVAKILPGRYTVLAVAEGFNPVTLSDVEVARAAELTYGFKLQRAGSGNTLPERRVDRNNPKWAIRSAQTSRSIYQNNDTGTPVTLDAGNAEVFETAPAAEVSEESGRTNQFVAETFFGAGGASSGVNAVAFLPIGEDVEFVVAGQMGAGRSAAQRLDVQAKFRPSDDHQIRINGSAGRFGSLSTGGDDRSLGQLSFQATDEWKIREGVVFVFGLDYSKFIGAGHDFSVSPRLGVQFDVDAKTRFRAAYTTQTEDRDWSRVIELEDAQVTFREPAMVEDLVIEDGKPQMNKSRRLEFGIERVLDNSSSVEANFFFDTTPGRGVGLVSLPFGSQGTEAAIGEFVGNLQGGAQGMRLVYSRRLSGRFSTAAGYSMGRGKQLSPDGIGNPAELFKNGFVQTAFGQFDADLRTGTTVRTIFRFSPEATVFAIDPFQGRLAIYDPSLSVLVTQDLPTLGLPFRAQAVLDARNIFGFQGGVADESGSLKLNSQQRGVRGSILVRF
jgi:hypothetical protein